MAKIYFVRIELHKIKEAHAEIYESLHKTMEKAGFLRYVIAGDRKKYHLPAAMYRFDSESTTSQVNEHARKHAMTVWSDLEVFTVQSMDWVGSGLHGYRS